MECNFKVNQYCMVKGRGLCDKEDCIFMKMLGVKKKPKGQDLKELF